MTIPAGKLRFPITIESLTGSTPDGYGNVRESWTAVYTNVPAAIEPSLVTELYGTKPETSATHKITIRYLPNITPKMRVKFAGSNRTWNITGVVNPEERNIVLELACREEFS